MTASTARLRSVQRLHLMVIGGRNVRALNEIALAHGQSLAQMVLAWVLRHARVTSALIGASRTAQITVLVGARHKLQVSVEQLAALDQHAVEGGIKLWQHPSTD